jgi:hypothetical protein
MQKKQWVKPQLTELQLTDLDKKTRKQLAENFERDGIAQFNDTSKPYHDRQKGLDKINLSKKIIVSMFN